MHKVISKIHEEFVLIKFIFVIALSVITISAFAEESLINIQGILRDVDNKAVADGSNYSLEFKIYDAQANGKLLCSEIHSNVKVVNGVYNVALGSSNEFKTLAFDKPYYVGLSVNGGTLSSPLIPLSVSPYARSVVGSDNKFPASGQVVVGGGDWQTDKVLIKKGGLEIQNDDADNQIRFHDPNNNHYYIGTDKSDANIFKIGTGAVVGDNDFISVDYNGTTTFNHYAVFKGPIFQKFEGSTYNLWIQGSTNSLAGGDERNLALLGIDEANGDKLIINYNTEYTNGTEVHGLLNVNGGMTIQGVAPMIVRSYKTWDNLDTGVSTKDYSAIVVGFDKGHLDYNENHAGWATCVVMAPNSNGHWFVRLRERTDSWQNAPIVHVMFIRKEICADERTLFHY